MINVFISIEYQTKFNRTGKADPRGKKEDQKKPFAPILEDLVKGKICLIYSIINSSLQKCSPKTAFSKRDIV